MKGRTRRRTENDATLRDGLLDLVIRLRKEEKDVYDLGLGALGEIVGVAADAEQGVRERLEDRFLRQDAAEVVARDRSL